MNAQVSTESAPKAKRLKKNFCVECAGLGERDPEKCEHVKADKYKGRVAVKAALDTAGRWMIQWRDADGTEWVGTYRLLPC